MGITKKQKEVYDYICQYLDKYGYSPTQREIKEHFNFKSFGSVQRYIKYLTEGGHLENDDWNARRGLRPKKESPQNTASSILEEIPLLGKVAAGVPIEAIENPEIISVPGSMLKGRGANKFFALNIEGNSMIEDGIFEGDTIICKEQKTASQGETIVAVIEGEATVKHYFKKENHVELHPANKEMLPIIVDRHSGDFKIVGSLVGLIRNY